MMSLSTCKWAVLPCEMCTQPIPQYLQLFFSGVLEFLPLFRNNNTGVKQNSGKDKLLYFKARRLIFEYRDFFLIKMYF